MKEPARSAYGKDHNHSQLPKNMSFLNTNKHLRKAKWKVETKVNIRKVFWRKQKKYMKYMERKSLLKTIITRIPWWYSG